MELYMPINYHPKGVRIYYEGPLPAIRDQAVREFNRVFKSSIEGIEREKNRLTIIDPYFLSVESKDAKETANKLQQILKDISLDEIKIFYRACPPKQEKCIFFRKCTFLQELQQKFPNVKIIRKRMTSKIHDRFWFYNNTSGVIVGTSLNGIGAKFSFAFQIPDDDLRELIEQLRKYQIEVEPCQP